MDKLKDLYYFKFFKMWEKLMNIYYPDVTLNKYYKILQKNLSFVIFLTFFNNV